VYGAATSDSPTTIQPTTKGVTTAVVRVTITIVRITTIVRVATTIVGVTTRQINDHVH
jgi:hypothetical protein